MKTIFVVIAISLCSIGAVVLGHNNCSTVSPQEYQDVFLGSVEILYVVYSPANFSGFPDCFYYDFGNLNDDNKTAPVTSYARNSTHTHPRPSSIVLTANGLAFQGDLNANIGWYESASITDSGVFIMTICGFDVYYIGCHLKNCASSVIATALQVAQHFVDSQPELSVATINNTHCINIPPV